MSCTHFQPLVLPTKAVTIVIRDQMPSVKVDQDENPNFRLRAQLLEISYQFLQQYWPLRFESEVILACIEDKVNLVEAQVFQQHIHLKGLYRV